MADNSTIRVLKGTEVEFKVDSTGGDATLRTLIRLETATWGGTTPGAAGAGAAKTITFGTNSANAATPSTVTVSFAGQTVHVNVIVFTLNIVSTPRDNFTNPPPNQASD